MNQQQVQIVNQDESRAELPAPHIPEPIPNKLTFENDFGKEPLLLAHLSKDQGMIAILTLAGAFIGATFGGLPIAGLILLAGINDLKCASAEQPQIAEKPLVPAPAPLPEPVVAPQEERQEIWRDARRLQAFEATEGLTESAQSVEQSIDIAREMGRIPKSTLIAASPRVGKGVLIVKALEYLAQFHPETEIWLLDPKAENSESHYWENLETDKKCHYDLRDFDVDIEEAAEIFSNFLIKFNRSTARSKLLIIDEFVTLNQKLPNKLMTQLKDFLVGICSSGELIPDQGIGRFVWCISQSPYVTDLGFKTKSALTTFQRVFLLNKASSSLYQIAASASFVPSGCDSKVNRLLEKHERICYYSRLDSWQPIPNYNTRKETNYNLARESLESLLPSFREVTGSSPEVHDCTGSFGRHPEAPEAQSEVGLPVSGEWRKYFPEAPEEVERAILLAYHQALKLEGGKKNFISQILKSGEGGRRYQSAVAYLDYLSQKFSKEI